MPNKEPEWTAPKVRLIRESHEELVEGDLVVLRLGTWEVYRVGEVVGASQ